MNYELRINGMRLTSRYRKMGSRLILCEHLSYSQRGIDAIQRR